MVTHIIKKEMLYNMINTLQKLNLNDIKVGMTIHDKDQLSNILDTVIILVKDTKDSEYKIAFIGDKPTEESDKIMENAGYAVCPVFNSSMDAEGDTYYEESEVV